MKLITIASSHNASDLYVLKSKLESEGVECFLKNELTTQVLNHIPSMDVELQISENDIPIFEEFRKKSGNPKLDKKITCPRCNSEEVRIKFDINTILRVIRGLFMSLISLQEHPNIYKSSIYKCLSCRNEFVSG